MNRTTLRPPRHFAALGFILVLMALSANAFGSPLFSGSLLKIEPSSTWVGIARVYLEIENLRQAGQKVEGTYRIRVPLSPAQNDTGKLLLHASVPLDGRGDNETTVIGSALSSTGQVHEVVAHIQPNGVVQIDVTTPARKLRFKSRYAARPGGSS